MEQQPDFVILDGTRISDVRATLDGVSYPARDVAVIDVKGWADRSRSSFDAYWYQGPVAGRWTFEAHMSYRFRSP